MTIWHMVAFVIGVILLLFSLTFYLYWYSRSYDCAFNPNPWCWYDWRCETANGLTYPAATLYGCGKDANGVAYPTRDANYCTQTTYPNPPGCQCIPDASGNIPASCTFEWNPDTMFECATALGNYRDGTDGATLVQQCQKNS